MGYRTILTVTIVALAAALPLDAQQDVCLPGANSHEAKTFAILSVPIAFTGARAPAVAHGISIGLEAATLPTVDSANSTPTSCRPEKGRENTHPVAGILRPRLAIAIHGFVIEGSWIPPVRVNGLKANLVGVAIARPFRVGDGVFVGVRAHAVFGSLDGPITCNDAALHNSASECYLGARSDDSWKPGVMGVEATVGAGKKNVRPHFGVGYTLLRPRFQVDFTNALGSTDRRQVNVDLQRVALFGGVTLRAGSASVTAEGYSTPADAISFRVVVRTLLAR